MLAVNYGNLGEVCMELGEFKEALDLFEQEHAWMQTLTRVDSDNQDYNFGFILAQRHLGDYYAHIQESSQAVDYYQSAIELTLSSLEMHDDVKRTHLLLAAIRTELAELLIDTDVFKATELIIDTADDLEHWLQEHQGEGEGWLYLAQARTNRYLVAVRTGDKMAAEGLRSQAFAAIAHINKSDRKKFANEINHLMTKLEKSPKAQEAARRVE
jgi:tetratricopeptide (TPR) repeat protein